MPGKRRAPRARAATGDDEAQVVLDRDLSVVDGYTIPGPGFSGEVHPFVTVRGDMGDAALEATALHESAHWDLGHVLSAEHRTDVLYNAAGGSNARHADDEVAADVYAIEKYLSREDILGLLRSDTASVEQELRNDIQQNSRQRGRSVP